LNDDVLGRLDTRVNDTGCTGFVQKRGSLTLLVFMLQVKEEEEKPSMPEHSAS
jgi:hypothetical protein